jgi:hypothetical protein
VAEPRDSRATRVGPAAPGGQAAPPSRRWVLAATAAGMLGAALACWLLDLLAHREVLGPLADSLFVTPFWQDAVAIVHGQLPYRDFPLEYPPLSLVPFLLPVLLPGGGLGFSHYQSAFELVMAACAIGLVPIVVATVVRLGGRRSEIALAAGLVAIAPLLLGSLTISRYDLWPALLTAAAMLALLVGRDRIAFAVLALAVLAKIYPAFLIPIFVAHVWRAAGPRRAILDTIVGGVVGVAGMAPFLAADPSGALDPFTRFIARPLQVESLGATILVGLHDWLGLPIDRVSYAFNSYNLDGSLPGIASFIQTYLLVALLVAIWLAAARGSADPRRLVLACAAAICVDVALGKVLSPQYVIWLVSPVAVLSPVRGARPLVALALILVLTQAYYPGLYNSILVGFDPRATVACLERNLGLLLLAIFLAAATIRGRAAGTRAVSAAGT